MSNIFLMIIAEDDPDLGPVLVRLIQCLDPRIVIHLFTSGLDALVGCARIGADVLFINHRMPDMSGLALTHPADTRRYSCDC